MQKLSPTSQTSYLEYSDEDQIYSKAVRVDTPEDPPTLIIDVSIVFALTIRYPNSPAAGIYQSP